jgi:hypothetical protein
MNNRNTELELSTSPAIEPNVCCAPVLSKRPWNYGKRKPVEEDGELWCNCKNPKLRSNAGGRGQAFCLLCGYPWYH